MWYIDRIEDIMLGQPIIEAAEAKGESSFEPADNTCNKSEESDFTLFRSKCEDKCLAAGVRKKLDDGSKNPAFDECVAKCRVEDREDKESKKESRQRVNWGDLLTGFFSSGNQQRQPAAQQGTGLVYDDPSKTYQNQTNLSNQRRKNNLPTIIGIIVALAIIGLIVYAVMSKKEANN